MNLNPPAFPLASPRAVASPGLEVVLAMRGIVKEFSGVRALDGVDFELRSGECLALAGENGAGKSTLMKVLSGVYPHGTFSGEIRRDGKEVQFRGIKDAESAGIAIIHQELSLFPELSVVENLFAGRLRRGKFGVDWDGMREEADGFLRGLGVQFGPDALAGALSVGDAQMVEIARALMKEAQILIFDEPTSALSEREVQRLFELINGLKERGRSCVYISHKLDEVYALCDRAVVLRDGRSVGNGVLPETPRAALITMMVGREMDALFPPKSPPPESTAAPVMSVQNLQVTRVGREPAVRAVSFSLRPGEIVGFGGMMGSGRTELLYGIFGHPDFVTTGQVSANGASAPARGSVAWAKRNRIGLVTEDRKQTGLHLDLSIRENISMASLGRVSSFGLLQPQLERKRVDKYMERLRIKATSPETPVVRLSGGNQQKVVLAKWAATHPKILMLDEPTRGVDVGAKFEIYQLLCELAESGVAVVVVSSEIPELVGLCHRVHVMRHGMLAGELAGAALTPENVLKLAIGDES